MLVLTPHSLGVWICAMGYQHILLMNGNISDGQCRCFILYMMNEHCPVQGSRAAGNHWKTTCAVGNPQNWGMRTMWDEEVERSDHCQMIEMTTQNVWILAGSSWQTEDNIQVCLVSSLPEELTVILTQICYLWKLEKVWKYENKRPLYLTVLCCVNPCYWKCSKYYL
jgi:hypothetical protein